MDSLNEVHTIYVLLVLFDLSGLTLLFQCSFGMSSLGWNFQSSVKLHDIYSLRVAIHYGMHWLTRCSALWLGLLWPSNELLSFKIMCTATFFFGFFYSGVLDAHMALCALCLIALSECTSKAELCYKSPFQTCTPLFINLAATLMVLYLN